MSQDSFDHRNQQWAGQCNPGAQCPEHQVIGDGRQSWTLRRSLQVNLLNQVRALSPVKLDTPLAQAAFLGGGGLVRPLDFPAEAQGGRSTHRDGVARDLVHHSLK